MLHAPFSTDFSHVPRRHTARSSVSMRELIQRHLLYGPREDIAS
jgi:hypothetical protein